MKRVLVFLAALLLPATQVAPQIVDVDHQIVVVDRDLDSTTYESCSMEGQGAENRNPDYPGEGRIQTSGSSTTISAVDAALNIFALPGVGDLLRISYAGRSYNRVIVTNANDDTITVDSAIDLSNGATFTFRKLSCGTADGDGAIKVAGYSKVNFIIQVTQEVSTSIEYKVQCRISGPSAVWVDVIAEKTASGTFATANVPVSPTTGGYVECRYAAKVTGDDDTTPATDNEKLSVYFLGER